MNPIGDAGITQTERNEITARITTLILEQHVNGYTHEREDEIVRLKALLGGPDAWDF